MVDPLCTNSMEALENSTLHLWKNKSGRRQITSYYYENSFDFVNPLGFQDHTLRTTDLENAIVTEDKFYAFKDRTVCLQKCERV